MSLMSMQLWTLAKIAGPLLVIVGLQTLLAAIYTLLVVFLPYRGEHRSLIVLPKWPVNPARLAQRRRPSQP